MHIVYYLNDNGDYILKSRHKNFDNAEIVAKVCEEAGFRWRIIKDGKIIAESE